MPESNARTLAGLAGTGTLSILAIIAFVYQLPSSFFPYTGGPIALEWLAFVAFYLVYVLISLPFDIWVGQPTSSVRLRGFLMQMLRGIGAQGLVMTLSALALLSAGRQWGIAGAAGCLAILLALLAAIQPRLGVWLGARGLTGWGLGSWALAAGWTLAGFVLIASLPWCGVSSVYTLLETLLGCTLWSLLGLLVLPRVDTNAARLALLMSWTCFGLVSRSTAPVAGRPERWAAPAEV